MVIALFYFMWDNNISIQNIIPYGDDKVTPIVPDTDDGKKPVVTEDEKIAYEDRIYEPTFRLAIQGEVINTADGGFPFILDNQSILGARKIGLPRPITQIILIGDTTAIQNAIGSSTPIDGRKKMHIVVDHIQLDASGTSFTVFASPVNVVWSE